MKDLLKRNVIYKITSPSGKIYIGQTSRRLKDRISDYSRGKNRKATYNYPIFKAIRKYGIENLKFTIIDEAKNKDELNKKEIYWIKFYNALSNKGFNCNKGGRTGGTSKQKRKAKIQLSISRNPNKVYVFKENKLLYQGYLRSEICSIVKVGIDRISFSIQGKCGFIGDGYWVSYENKTPPTKEEIEKARIKMNEYAEKQWFSVYFGEIYIGKAKGRYGLKKFFGLKFISPVDKLIKNNQKYNGYSIKTKNHEKLRIRYWL